MISLQKHLRVSNLGVFKRSSKQERWELKDNSAWNKAQILEDFEELDLVKAIRPQKDNYETAVLLGAIGPRMQTRIDYLIDLWDEGIRFKRIVFLTGNRDIGTIDMPSKPGHSKNETDLFKLLWRRAEKPKAFEKIPTLWIDAPKIKQPDGSLTRPTTLSTLNAWAQQENLEHQDILAISNQPFVQYQQCVLANHLPKNTRIETVGATADNDTPISVYLDALIGCQPTR
jgi:hypothetical protein